MEDRETYKKRLLRITQGVLSDEKLRDVEPTVSDHTTNPDNVGFILRLSDSSGKSKTFGLREDAPLEDDMSLKERVREWVRSYAKGR